MVLLNCIVLNKYDIDMIKLFSTGYEKESLDEFISKLEKAGIGAVIDVREIPLSRKNGFSKKTLEVELNKRNIKYYHFPELGSPRKIRHELYSTGDYLSFFKAYRKYVHNEKPAVEQLNKVISEEKTSTLMCFEKNEELCHRSIITSEIMKINPEVTVTPI